MRRANDKRRGSSLLEFTLVGVPLIFVVISTFEMARGMWLYHTLAYAVKEATRYAIVHGSDCATAPNACTVTIGQIATKLQNAGVGLPPDQLNVTFTSINGSVNCVLSNCLTNNTVWPTAPGNAPGSDLQISANYPFKSFIVMVWPGVHGSVADFGTVNLPASSKEVIQF